MSNHAGMLAAVLALACTPAHAEKQAFSGVVHLAVDATDVDRQVFKVRQSIPVQRPGALTLLYPQWEVGSHAPTASVTELAGLRIQADGKPLAWRRDARAPHAFDLVVPSGARMITVDFQYLAPQRHALLKPDMVSLPWHRLLLYPAGWPTSTIPVRVALTVPPGLALAGALDVERQDGGKIDLRTTSLEALVDAPAYAARHRRVIPLSKPHDKPVVLDIVSRDPRGLAVPEDEIERLQALVEETRLVFGPAPFRRYHALAILDDDTAGGGIEHLEQGENFLPADYFTALDRQLPNRDLIAHEYVHAWNGRFRLPADMHVADYNTAVGGSLLWLYEGQTELWGRILAARAGQRSLEHTLDRLAIDAALVANRSARAWKTLRDSTNDPLFMSGRPVEWRDWQRRQDYYFEGAMLWLHVEARLRELTGGQRGLDDFAQRFFATDGRPAPLPYDIDEVVRTLTALAPNDWRAFLDRHLDTHDDAEALAGLARSGWRLAWRATPSASWQQEEQIDGVSNLDHSIGIQVRSNGSLRSVAWDSPAFRAGLAPGAKIVSVNGAPFEADLMVRRVAAAHAAPIILDVEAHGRRRSVELDYRGTLRYPAIERIPGVPDRLTPLLAARRQR